LVQAHQHDPSGGNLHGTDVHKGIGLLLGRHIGRHSY
jgi:hypothetical protein